MNVKKTKPGRRRHREFIRKHSLQKRTDEMTVSSPHKEEIKDLSQLKERASKLGDKSKRENYWGGSLNRSPSSWPISEKKLYPGEDRAPKQVQESDSRGFLTTSHYVPNGRECSQESRMEAGMFQQKEKPV